MYARTTTVTASPAAVETGIANVRDEVWPAVRDMTGCLGLSMLVDRESGRSIVATSWETEEALRASREKVLPLRDRAVELMGSAKPVVDEWEIASMHRTHATRSDTFVRTAWSRVNPANVQRALDFYRSTLLKEMEKMEGFASASLLIDRPSGQSVLSVAYDSREAVERPRDKADYLRAKGSQEVDVEWLDFAEFELVLAHLHVPEQV